MTGFRGYTAAIRQVVEVDGVELETSALREYVDWMWVYRGERYMVNAIFSWVEFHQSDTDAIEALLRDYGTISYDILKHCSAHTSSRETRSLIAWETARDGSINVRLALPSVLLSSVIPIASIEDLRLPVHNWERILR